MNLPNTSDARIRTNNEVKIKREDYIIPEEIKNIGKNKKYCIITYGCQMNVHDSENISAIMEELGYKKQEELEGSDVIILNTCAIRENAHNKVIGMLGRIKHLKEINNDIITVFCGCMAQEVSVTKKLEEKYPWVDIVMGTHNFHKLPVYLDALMKKKTTRNRSI